MFRPVLRALLACLLALAAALVVAGPASAAAPTPVVPTTPAGLPTDVEQFARYVGQDSCDTRNRPGTVKLAKLLAHTYSRYGATAWSTNYACGSDGSQSEHYEGRAIDWMVDLHNTAQRTAAFAFLKWALATDKAGNRAAMARRLGIMYVIYDNRIWGGWGGSWEPYNGCAKLPGRANDNACHRTHMHISLSWDGAYGRTSYWTKHVVTRTDVGPCRPADLNWAYRYTAPNYDGCPRYPTVRAPKGASALKRTLVQYSGAAVTLGSSGPIVSAVQQALHVSASGSYGSRTVAAVRSLQSRVHVASSGVMTPATWRALLAHTK